MAKFNSPNTLSTSIIYDNGLMATINGSVLVSGILTSNGYFGPATGLTNLQSSSLVGTISSSLINGPYSGITSVGTLSQLNVSGISTLGVTSFTSYIIDSSGSIGDSNQLLSIRSNLVYWTSLVSIGGIGGTVGNNQIAFGYGSNLITGVSTFVYYNGNVGLGTTNPTNILTVTGGDALINGLTIGLGSAGLTSNLAIGYQALAKNTSLGTSNLAIGYNALGLNTSGYANLAIGYQALGVATGGAGHLAIGYQALSAYLYDSTFGQVPNIAIGYQALLSCTSGVQNLCIGYQASKNVTTGGNHVIIGKQAGNNIQTSFGNIVIGWQAMSGGSNDAGYNVVIGYTAASASSYPFSYNVVIGNNAGYYLKSTYQVAIGVNALYGNSNTALMTGLGNVAIGYAALGINTGGSYNTAVGQQALGLNTSGSNNTAFGYNAGLANSTGANNTFVGAFASGLYSSNFQIAIGASVFVKGSNMGAWGGNTNTTYSHLGVGTFSPLSRLQINTLGVSTGLIISGSGSTSYNFISLATSDATINAQPVFVVTGIGSVGIGVSTPTQSLHVQNGALFNGLFSLGVQSFVASGTISSTLGSLVNFSGATASQTINLPASFTTGGILYFNNQGTVQVGLSTNTGQSLYVTSIQSIAGTSLVSSISTSILYIQPQSMIEIIYPFYNIWYAK